MSHAHSNDHKAPKTATPSQYLNFVYDKNGNSKRVTFETATFPRPPAASERGGPKVSRRFGRGELAIVRGVSTFRTANCRG